MRAGCPTPTAMRNDTSPFGDLCCPKSVSERDDTNTAVDSPSGPLDPWGETRSLGDQYFATNPVPLQDRIGLCWHKTNRRSNVCRSWIVSGILGRRTSLFFPPDLLQGQELIQLRIAPLIWTWDRAPRKVPLAMQAWVLSLPPFEAYQEWDHDILGECLFRMRQLKRDTKLGRDRSCDLHHCCITALGGG